MLLLVMLACQRTPPAAEAPSPSAVARACAAAPCSGPTARVAIWRDAEGRLALLEHRGDPDVCSHPPTVWLDPETMAERLGQEERLVTREEAAQMQAERAALLAGLTEAGTVGCPAP